MSVADWVRGDFLGLEIPAHPDALRQGGAAFLTKAFRAADVLPYDDRVTRIAHLEDFLGGGTGRKALLSVEYEQGAALQSELFVKFSRDFTAAWRDRGKHMMESEVRLALLSRDPRFPIPVPACYFSDYHLASNTGILITERIAFGSGSIERAYEKARDYELPEPLQHYRALIKANARLAGSHRAQKLPGHIEEQFPYEPSRLLAADRIPYGAAEMQEKTAALARFATQYPQLLPAELSSPAFLARFAQEAQCCLAHESVIKDYLYGSTRFVALCHWNANVDNAWFWRNAQGELECGLLDWQRVTQLNVAQALFGSLCPAETQLWDEHLDELLDLFAVEFRNASGHELDVGELELQLLLFTAVIGCAWIVNAPSVIQREVPELARVESRFDPRLSSNERARTQLQLLSVFLNAWRTHDIGAVIERFLATRPAASGLVSG
jgi:hypothetical protein